MSIYNWAWDLKPLYIQGYLVDDTVGFLVNHTKGIYIDMRKVFNKEVLIFDNAGNSQTINPLPFLTSVGNSNNSDIKDRELIGTWAFDIIGYYEELPNKDLKEFIGLNLSNTSYKL